MEQLHRSVLAGNERNHSSIKNLNLGCGYILGSPYTPWLHEVELLDKKHLKGGFTLRQT